MNSKKILSISVLISSLFALPVHSEVMKLKNAVETAVTSNPEVLKIYNNYQAFYSEELAAIGSGFLPSIDYTYQNFDETRSDPNTNNGVGSRNYNRINRGISIRQNLFNGFFDYNNVMRLSHAARGKIFELENTSSVVATDTTRAYVDLVRYRTLTSLAEDNYVTLKTLYEQLKLKVDAGVAKKSDLEQAQSRLSLADYTLTVESANLHDIEARFLRLVGELPPKEIDNNITINKDIPKDPIAALTLAQKNNPALVASFEDVEQQISKRNTVASAYVPRVDLRAFKDSNINTNGVQAFGGVGDGQFRNEGVGVELTWNLFKGGADINTFSKEENLYHAALDNRDRICRDVREQLQVGYNDIRKFTEQVAYLDQRQIAIEKARDAYRKQFEINQRSLIDLLNAENELFEAKRAYTNASNDLAIAYARTHNQLGTILQALGITRYKSDKIARPTDTKVDIGYASCPITSPTPYKADRKMLDQRATDAMVSLSISGDSNAPVDANPENASVNKGDKKKSSEKKGKSAKEKEGASKVEPLTTKESSPSQPESSLSIDDLMQNNQDVTQLEKNAPSPDTSTDKKKLPVKKGKSVKDKEVVPKVEPLTSNNLPTSISETAASVNNDSIPNHQELIQPLNVGSITEPDLSSPAKIKAFQKTQGLAETGKLNKSTRAALKRLKELNTVTSETNVDNTQITVETPQEPQTTSMDVSAKQSVTSETPKEEPKSEEKVGLFGRLSNYVKSFISPANTETTMPKAEIVSIEPDKTSAKPQSAIEETTPAMETNLSPTIFSEPDLSSPEKVKAFQKSQGIPQTGFVGERTKKALKRLHENSANASLTPIDEMSPPINIGSN